MNYRHGFHAGNFADCMKHALLVWLLGAMARKPAPFLLLDTHAGAGLYDLGDDAARRTGEWQRGVGRLRPPGPGGPPPPLAPFLYALEAAAPPGHYPGSPVLARALLRPDDRLVCCELHPEEHATLRRHLARPIAAHPPGASVAVHARDGYAALRAFLPPPERRALVLLDPPFEAPDEFARLAAALTEARRRFPPAVLAAWYPIKGRAPVRAFHDALRGAGLPDLVAAELRLREPTDAARLNGCGLLVATPPWRFEAEVPPILDALLARLGDGEAGAGTAVLRLADE